jgi:hypothetical protein
MDLLSAGALVATPLLAFTGALTGQWWARKGVVELATWRRREETMRLLRWAVERSSEENDRAVAAGMAALEALVSSELLQDHDRALVENVIDALQGQDWSAYAHKIERWPRLHIVQDPEEDP